MKHNSFSTGDKKQYNKVVSEADVATFESGPIHPVYSTFALGRDAEYCSRFFLLDLKDENEEGIGTALTINHVSPALPGETIEFVSEFIKLIGNEVSCTFESRVGARLVAFGETKQKVVKKEKLKNLFEHIRNGQGYKAS